MLSEYYYLVKQCKIKILSVHFTCLITSTIRWDLHLINFDRQTLRRGITLTIRHLDGETKCSAGSWLTTDNAI